MPTMTEEPPAIDPYISGDSGYDSEGLTPRSLSKLHVAKRKHKKAWEEQEFAKLKANRASNTEVWKKYLDKHVPMVFLPETAKLVEAMSKSNKKSLLYPDGKKYHGLTRGIKPEGTGTMHWPEGGGSYHGTWKLGVPHGQGRRIYANGESYVGRWKDGRRHGFGVITAGSSDQIVLYEGLWREGSKAHQADYAAGLPSPDRQEMHKSRLKFNNIGSIASAADLMVEKMISDPASLGTEYNGPRYLGSRRENLSSNKQKNRRGQLTAKSPNMDKELDQSAIVSAYYVKKEKLKNIKHAWYSYPSTAHTAPLRQIAHAKIDVRIKKKYDSMKKNIHSKDGQNKLSMQALKSIYLRERNALMDDYKRGLELLHEKFQKQRRMTLKMGIMRGGIAIERSVREVKKLKDQYIEKNQKMMERRQRSIIRMKEEYMTDMCELRATITNDNVRTKKNYLQFAWSRNKLEMKQEVMDQEREFAVEKRIEFERKQKLRIKQALSGQTVQRSINADNDLEDNDGMKSRRLYQLSSLSKCLKPSLKQELNIAWKKWKEYNSFKSSTEHLRLNLVNIHPASNATILAMSKQSKATILAMSKQSKKKPKVKEDMQVT